MSAEVTPVTPASVVKPGYMCDSQFDLESYVRIRNQTERKRVVRKVIEIVVAPFGFLFCLCLPNRTLEDITGTTHERP
jgi:hypothetical protein